MPSREYFEELVVNCDIYATCCTGDDDGVTIKCIILGIIN